MRRLVASVVILALTLGGVGAAGAATKPKPKPVAPCTERTLVLSAMPVELNAVLARLDRASGVTTKTIGGHDYYFGRYGRARLVLTLTGIGPANARHAIDAATDAFWCGRRPAFREVVFSGVAGGDYIGDVVVPSSWSYRIPGGGGLVEAD